jgi:hypothetical protein
MNRLAKLQLIGPLAVFVAALAAEFAAAALARWPSSEMLWRVNLEWFRAFQKSSYVLSGYEITNHSQFWIIASPLIAISFCGIVLKRPLLIAAGSNLSLVYTSFVLYVAYLYEQPWRMVSLSLVNILSDPNFVLCFLLVATSFLSFAVSHFVYIRAVLGGDR